jgi:hypothetical protein
MSQTRRSAAVDTAIRRPAASHGTRERVRAEAVTGISGAIARPPAIATILRHLGLPVEVSVPAPARQLGW